MTREFQRVPLKSRRTLAMLQPVPQLLRHYQPNLFEQNSKGEWVLKKFCCQRKCSIWVCVYSIQDKTRRYPTEWQLGYWLGTLCWFVINRFCSANNKKNFWKNFKERKNRSRYFWEKPPLIFGKEDMELALKLQKELEAAEPPQAIKEPTKEQSDYELAVKLAKELEGDEKKPVVNNDELDVF